MNYCIIIINSNLVKAIYIYHAGANVRYIFSLLLWSVIF